MAEARKEPDPCFWGPSRKCSRETADGFFAPPRALAATVRLSRRPFTVPATKNRLKGRHRGLCRAPAPGREEPTDQKRIPRILYIGPGMNSGQPITSEVRTQ